MRQLIAYFFLAVMLNVLFFHPLETIQHNFSELENDPINSVAEFVMEVCLDIEDTLAGDEREAESEHFSGFGKLFTTHNNGYTILPNIEAASTSSTPEAARELIFICKGYMTVFSPPPEFL
ncbi:MAG: hypothetical protein KF803_15245 [Cyclobacteriaceae bacterium]|nr:hypothetical protein [Cyclobacteriaceae bacterium]